MTDINLSLNYNGTEWRDLVLNFKTVKGNLQVPSIKDRTFRGSSRTIKFSVGAI